MSDRADAAAAQNSYTPRSKIESESCELQDVIHMSQRGAQLKLIQQEAYKLFEKKNHDYGDAFATYGPIGIIVRIGDKVQRLTKISATEVSLVNDESLRDTLIDLHNYAAMALMLLDEKRPLHPRVAALRSEARNLAPLDLKPN